MTVLEQNGNATMRGFMGADIIVMVEIAVLVMQIVILLDESGLFRQ